MVCSSGNVDMMGDEVVQAGADLSVYKRNPIVLFSHNPEHPVGTAKDLKMVDGCWTAEIEFAPAGLSHKADEVCALVKSGVLKSVSIGFDPTDAEPINPSKPRGPQRYKRWILCEISVVAIPANNDAVVTEKSYPDSAGTAQASTETVVTENVSKELPKLKFKGLYDVGCFASLLQDLGWAHCSAVYEKACEGDDSEVPGKLAELVHMAAEALLAMTQEEVAEMLAQVDERDNIETVDGTDKATKASVRKFRAGVSVSKAGKAVSKATADVISDAVDTHNALVTAHKVHTKCMKDFADIVGAKSTTKSAATPGIAPQDAEPVVKDLIGSHEAVHGALKMHHKCMKALNDMAPGRSHGGDDDNVGVIQTSDGVGEGGTSTEKSLPRLSAAERKRKARALAVAKA